MTHVLTAMEIRDLLAERRAARVREAGEEQGSVFGYDRAQEIQDEIEGKLDQLLAVFVDDEVPQEAALALARVVELVVEANLPEVRS